MISRSAGFTLLEVLMVIFIMGLMASMVTAALPGSSTLEGSAEEQADKLILIMEDVSDRAAMEGRIIGLHVSELDYEFEIQTKAPNRTVKNMKLQDELKRTWWDQLSWVTYDVEDLATKKEFDEGVTASLEVGGLSVEADTKSPDKLEDVDFKEEEHSDKKNIPQIFFYPTGEVTPFRLRFYVEGNSDSQNPIMIIGEELGNFRRFDPEKDRL